MVLPSVIRQPLANIVWHAFVYPKILQRAEVDVIHVPDFRRFIISTSIPSIVTIHDMARYVLPNKYDPVRMFYHQRILPIFLKRFTHVIAVSENTKHDVLRFFPFLEDRISVVHDGISHSLYRPLPKDVIESVRSKLQLPQHYVLYVSRIEHPAKNHVRLLKAFHRIKQNTNLPHKLVLVGSPSFRSSEVYETAHSLGDDVIFTGFVPTCDLPAVYNGAETFVFPSLYEGFGLPVLEAMACGVPVVASNVASIPEVAGEAAVLVDPYEVNEIAEVLEKLLVDLTVQDRLRQRGFERVKKFSWEETARETLAVYEHVLTRSAESG
jgi:glycosyltransferase involved in cell wall biosynthesis